MAIKEIKKGVLSYLHKTKQNEVSLYKDEKNVFSILVVDIKTKEEILYTRKEDLQSLLEMIELTEEIELLEGNPVVKDISEEDRENLAITCLMNEL